MKAYEYFEVQPKGGHVPDGSTFREFSEAKGRTCEDVCLIVGRKLVLLSRKEPPYKGLWLAGSGTVWSEYTSMKEYLRFLIRRDYGLEITEHAQFQLLGNRRLCLAERPIPEVCSWAACVMSPADFRPDRFNRDKYNALVKIASPAELESALEQHEPSGKKQAKALRDLWEELSELDLVG